MRSSKSLAFFLLAYSWLKHPAHSFKITSVERNQLKKSQASMVQVSELVFLVFQLLCFICGLALGFWVHQYIQNKMTGMITSIDLAIGDSVKINGFFIGSMLILDIFLVIIPGQVNETIARLLYAMFVISAEIIGVSKIVNHWHRYILIFHQHLPNGYSDQEINNIGRFLKATGLLTCTVLDILTTKPGYKSGTVKRLTNEDTYR